MTTGSAAFRASARLETQVAAEFVKNIEEMEKARGIRRDLILDGLDRVVKQLRKAAPLH